MAGDDFLTQSRIAISCFKNVLLIFNLIHPEVNTLASYVRSTKIE